MIFGFGNKPKLLDDESIHWMLDVFAWASMNLNQRKLKIATALIYPNNKYFPGTGNDVADMATLIFSQVKTFAGIESVSCDLQNEEGISIDVKTESVGTGSSLMENNEKLIFRYHTHTLNNPEVLIASFAHQIAYSIVATAHTPPPGGTDNSPHAAELLAVFMGFGLIMANTANTQKIRSCGSCSGPAVERESFLSQYDITYALAVFSTCNNLPVKEVTPHLKKSLQVFYKKSCKEILDKNYPHSTRLQKLQKNYLSNNHRAIRDNH